MVDVTGMREKIKRIVDEKMRMAMEAVNEYEWMVFRTEGEYTGAKWQPISEKTRSIRQMFGVNPDNPVLHARGILSEAWEVRAALDPYRATITLQFADVYNVWDQMRGAPPMELASLHHFGHGRRYPKRQLFTAESLRAWVLGVLK